MIGELSVETLTLLTCISNSEGLINNNSFPFSSVGQKSKIRDKSKASAKDCQCPFSSENNAFPLSVAFLPFQMNELSLVLSIIDKFAT
ncbi:MAG: hypothetical protein K9W46_02910 [Candidatus Heimdallarchaeum endolithica]|uniref:Uncharacterized protein n=1 Tax=Candidatus Heimdallarchaeum endolithica TaxID=2876572 RepID=A0A9Y1FP55_9ARCH|nr:MAG: hypothetical protein K9W46_02910 [Candidatus Heimdallarchaeum endolithica]